jgi:hypothetical protein
VSAEDLEKYETEMELQLYREYRDVVRLFSYVVETERRFYLTNDVQVTRHTDGGETYFEAVMTDAWVHVPPGAFREERPGADVQGRERRGAAEIRPRSPGGTSRLSRRRDGVGAIQGRSAPDQEARHMTDQTGAPAPKSSPEDPPAANQSLDDPDPTHPAESAAGAAAVTGAVGAVGADPNDNHGIPVVAVVASPGKPDGEVDTHA